MPSIHTPERFEGESFEYYKQRRIASKRLAKHESRGVPMFRDSDSWVASNKHFLTPHIKNTKHTRAHQKDSTVTSRKGKISRRVS